MIYTVPFLPITTPGDSAMASPTKEEGILSLVPIVASVG